MLCLVGIRKCMCVWFVILLNCNIKKKLGTQCDVVMNLRLCDVPWTLTFNPLALEMDI